MISSKVYSLSFAKPKGSGFHAVHRSFTFDNLGLKNGVLSPFSSKRGQNEIRREGRPEYFSLQFPLSGSQYVEQGGISTILKPGDAFLWNSESDAKLEIRERTEVISITVPKTTLFSGLKGRSQIQVLPPNSGLVRLLASTVQAVTSVADTIDADHYKTLEDVIFGLLTATVSHPRDELNSSAQSLKLERVKQFIWSEYTDPELSPGKAAGKLGLSIRDLHLVFSDDRDTFMSYLMKTRLHFARGALKRQAVSITEVAYSNGFNSSAQFSRAFRRSTGMSPREYRKLHT